jgi:hypothetical protein
MQDGQKISFFLEYNFISHYSHEPEIGEWDFLHQMQTVFFQEELTRTKSGKSYSEQIVAPIRINQFNAYIIPLNVFR